MGEARRRQLARVAKPKRQNKYLRFIHLMHVVSKYTTKQIVKFAYNRKDQFI